MKRNSIWLSLILATLSLPTQSFAWDHPGYPGPGYPQPGYGAFPRPDQLHEVSDLAYRIESVNFDLYNEARQYSYPGDYNDQQALQNVQRLEASARNFRLAVQNSYNDGSRTVGAYQQLRRDYDVAQPTFYQLRAYSQPRVQTDITQLNQAVSQLGYYYQYAPGPVPQPLPQPQPGYDRYLGSVTITTYNTGTFNFAVNQCGLSYVQLRTSGNDSNIGNFFVQYRDGEWEEIPVRDHFREGTTSNWKPLRGGNRCISQIQIRGDTDTDTGHQWGLAQIAVYGR